MSRMSKGLLLAVFAAISFSSLPAVFAGHVNLFPATGQSNAWNYWGDAIEDRLSDGIHNAEVVWSFHPGHYIRTWSKDGQRQLHYSEDFYSHSGDSVLQERIQEIELSGDTWSIEAVFFLQGESDTANFTEINLYEERHRDMQRFLEEDYGYSDIPWVVSVIDADFSFGVPSGRTQSQIDGLREVQFTLGGDFLSVDTRGYERTDFFHISPSERVRLGRDTARKYLQKVGLLLEGDANADGVVNGADFVVWNNNKFTSSDQGVSSGDFNEDGFVNGDDYILWNENRFRSISSVPEPCGHPISLTTLFFLYLYSRRLASQ